MNIRTCKIGYVLYISHLSLKTQIITILVYFWLKTTQMYQCLWLKYI